MEFSDQDREKLLAAFPWAKSFDATLRSSKSFSDAVARLKNLPVRRVPEIGKRRRKRHGARKVKSTIQIGK